jgi:thiamine biosynthesis lipoprotein
MTSRAPVLSCPDSAPLAASSPDAARAEFAAMGTLVRVIFTGGPARKASSRARLVASLRQLVQEIENQLSVFRPSADVVRLARHPGEWLTVGQHTASALAEAVRLRQATGGLFDPAMPGRSIEVRKGRPGEPAEARLGDWAGGRLSGIGQNVRDGTGGGDCEPGGVDVAAALTEVEGPRPGCGELDLGAIGKGYAVDACLELCRQGGAESALVSAGSSSIAVYGLGLGGGRWRIGLRDPGVQRDQVVGVVELAAGGLATSGLDQQPGHIVDPRTGRPVDSGVLQVSVWAASALTAEAYSTALMVGGPALAARVAVDSVLVTSRSVLVSPGAREHFRIGARGGPRFPVEASACF